MIALVCPTTSYPPPTRAMCGSTDIVKSPDLGWQFTCRTCGRHFDEDEARFKELPE